jgi:hypothetical protein
MVSQKKTGNIQILTMDAGFFEDLKFFGRSHVAVVEFDNPDNK